MPAIDFETEAGAALGALQHAMRAVIDALPGPPSTPTELGRTLDIDRNLAWKAQRLAISADPVAAASSVPGRAALRSFVDAAAARKVPAPLLEAVTIAEEGYRQMVRRHAGDRASAALMLGAQLASDPAHGGGGTGGSGGGAGSGGGGGSGGGEGPATTIGGADLGLRRAAYRAASFLAGVRVRTQLSTFIVAPGSDPDRVDITSVKGFYDIERIRPGAPFVMTRPRAAVGGAAYARAMDYGAIEPPPAGTQLPLLADFCSSPLPAFTPITGDEGFVEDELEDRPVGKTGACTIVRATRSPNLLPRFKSPGDATAEVSTRLRTPCAVVVLDKFVHDDAYGRDLRPWVRVYNDLAGEAAWVGERQARYLVPVRERVEELGRGLSGVHTPDVPRYAPMLSRVFERLGCDPASFTAFRVRIELPLIPSTLMLVHDQLDR